MYRRRSSVIILLYACVVAIQQIYVATCVFIPLNSQEPHTVTTPAHWEDVDLATVPHILSEDRI